MKLSMMVILPLIIALPFNSISSIESPGVDFKDTIDKRSLLLQRDYMKQSEISLKELYHSRWIHEEMNLILEKAVSDAIDEVKKETGYWTQVEFLWDEEIQKIIMEDILEKFTIHFAPAYEKFIEAFIREYSKYLREFMIKFSQNLKTVREEESRFLAGYQVLAGIHLEPVLAKIEANTEIPEIESYIGLGNFKGASTIAGIQVLRKILISNIRQKMVKKGVKTLGVRIVHLTEGPFGWVITILLLSYDIWDLGATFKEVPLQLKQSFADTASKSYLHNAPYAFWEGISPDLEREFDKVILLFKGHDDLVQQLANCQPYHKLSETLSPVDQNNLAYKLLLLQNQTQTDLCRMAEILGPRLDRVLPANLNCIASAINDLGLEDTTKWVKYAGNDFCVLNNLPNNIWRKYEPSVQSVITLLWLSNLPKPYRSIALELLPDTASWIRENLNQHQQNKIFRKAACVADIEDEVAQLKNLPPIEDVKSGFMGIWNDVVVQVQETLIATGRVLKKLQFVLIFVASISVLVLLMKWILWIRRELLKIKRWLSS